MVLLFYSVLVLALLPIPFFAQAGSAFDQVHIRIKTQTVVSPSQVGEKAMKSPPDKDTRPNTRGLAEPLPFRAFFSHTSAALEFIEKYIIPQESEYRQHFVLINYKSPGGLV